MSSQTEKDTLDSVLKQIKNFKKPSKIKVNHIKVGVVSHKSKQVLQFLFGIESKNSHVKKQ